jgi:acetyl esterase/lipase
MFRRIWLPALWLVFISSANILAQQPAQPAVPDNVAIERDIEYGKAGTTSLKLDVLRPKQPAKTPLPVIVHVHGGGWLGGDKAQGIKLLAPYVASGDYSAVTINYRLSQEAIWPAQIHDCKAALRWVRANAKKYDFDPERIAVWGGSAGGHLVSMLGTTADQKEFEGNSGTPGQSTRVTCVLDFCGPTDLRNIQPEEKAVLPMLRQLLGGMPEEKPEAAKSASPIVFVHKNCPPFLIVHGTADRLVPFQQATIFYDALKAAGVEATLVKIDGGGHDSPGKLADRAVVREFLDKHLRGKQ